MKALKTAAAIGLVVLTGAAQAVPVSGQGTWETTLQARDIDKDGTTDAFYDTELKVTWLRAGRAAMEWGTAKAWAEDSNFFGLSGWRLPTTRVTTVDGSCDWSETGGTSCGLNPLSDKATGSEMAHLFFQTLGNRSIYAPGTTDEQAGWGLGNTGDFQNLHSTYYWSGTEVASGWGLAWFFNTKFGYQYFEGKSIGLFALAVHPGDVAAAVPEPQTWALTLLGLTVVLLARRRRMF